MMVGNSHIPRLAKASAKDSMLKHAHPIGEIYDMHLHNQLLINQQYILLAKELLVAKQGQL